MDNITAFYLDSKWIRRKLGFTYSDCMNFTVEEFESCHSHIQWLFPNLEPSAYNPNAPYPSVETLNDFADYEILKKRLLDAVSRYTEIYFSRDFWISPRNHNFLRITRIIKCLKLFRLQEELEHFWILLQLLIKSHGAIIGEKTIKYWTEAYNA